MRKYDPTVIPSQRPRSNCGGDDLRCQAAHSCRGGEEQLVSALELAPAAPSPEYFDETIVEIGGQVAADVEAEVTSEIEIRQVIEDRDGELKIWTEDQ